MQPDDFSELALHKLASSGITPRQATAAGLYSVENAKADVCAEFLQAPALVIPYFDRAGVPIFFERDGERISFLRIRYLAEPAVRGFTKLKPQRYAQLKGSGVHAYFPRIRDWQEIAANPDVPVVIVEGELKALKACIEGVPTIGLGGVDNFRTRQRVAA